MSQISLLSASLWAQRGLVDWVVVAVVLSFEEALPERVVVLLASSCVPVVELSLPLVGEEVVSIQLLMVVELPAAALSSLTAGLSTSRLWQPQSKSRRAIDKQSNFFKRNLLYITRQIFKMSFSCSTACSYVSNSTTKSHRFSLRSSGSMAISRLTLSSSEDCLRKIDPIRAFLSRLI